MACVIIAVTLQSFGFHQGVLIITAMLVAATLPHAFASRLSWWSRGCSIALTIASIILVASAINYIWSVTLDCGATLEEPWLEAGSKRYYNWALHHYDGRCPEPLITFFGFPIIMLVLWKVLGVSIVWPVAMNLSLTVTAIIMSGNIAARLVKGRTSMSPTTAGMLAISLMCLHGYFLMNGIWILKEATIYVAMTMIMLGLLILQDDDPHNRRCTTKAIALYAGACIILALVRAKFINFAAFGIVLLAVVHWRDRKTSLFILVAITFVTWLMGMACSTTYNISQQVDNVTGGAAMTQSLGAPSYYILYYYQNWEDGYFYLPVWKKLLYLPFNCGIQYVFPPLPWRAEDATWLRAFPRFRVGWYLCGGLAIMYYLLVSWRKRLNVGLVAWWPVICTIAIAYITAGGISRYFLCFQPTYVAIAIYVIALIRDNTHRRTLLWGYVIYLILLATALITAYLWRANL